MQRGVVFGATGVMFLLASAAHADPLPPLPPGGTAAQAPATAVPNVTPVGPSDADTVNLRNGSFFRGRVTELVPQDHVTIVLPSNEVKRLAWTEIEKIVLSQPPPQVVAPPQAPPPLVGPLVRVRIQSSVTTHLYRRPAGSASWTLACASPCGVELPLGDDYKLAASGATQAKEFRLRGSPGGSVEIIHSPPNGLGVLGGSLLAGAGGTGMAVGALLSLVGIAQLNANCSSSYVNDPQRCVDQKATAPKVRDAGLVTLGVSTLIAGAGLYIAITSAQTDVFQQEGGGPVNDAWLRRPEWQRAAPETAAMSGPAATFPAVFTRSF